MDNSFTNDMATLIAKNDEALSDNERFRKELVKYQLANQVSDIKKNINFEKCREFYNQEGQNHDWSKLADQIKNDPDSFFCSFIDNDDDIVDLSGEIDCQEV